MFRIFYQRGKCIGCNACVEDAPQRWRVSTRDGRCSLVGGLEKKGIFQAIVDDEEYEQNVKAAANCPMRIIRMDTDI